jgi:hypothetical protein
MLIGRAWSFIDFRDAMDGGDDAAGVSAEGSSWDSKREGIVALSAAAAVLPATRKKRRREANRILH